MRIICYAPGQTCDRLWTYVASVAQCIAEKKQYEDMKKDNEFQRLSATIAWIRFPLILCVVLLHCYCTVTLAPGDHSLYYKLVYPFGLWLGESGVPTFFFISGFLFYVSHKTYQEKVSSRIHTLLYPYLFWNTLFLSIYIILFLIGHPQDILGRSIGDYNTIDYIRLYIDRGEYADGNNGPILCTYWYVRNLFILCLLSPIWYYLNKYLNFIWSAVLLAWWMSLHHNALLAESLLFFNLGAYFAINNINPLKTTKIERKFLLYLWLIFAITDNLSHTIFPLDGAFYLHRISLVLNIFGFLHIADIITHGDKQKTNTFLAGSVFWIFATHDHLAIAIRKLCVKYFSNYSDIIQVILYFATFFFVLAICLTSYYVTKRIFPHLVNFATGNRTK